MHRVLCRSGIDRLQLRLGGGVAGDDLELLAQPFAATQPIDCAVARGRGDPRPRVVRNTAPGLGFERRDERILQGLLGQVEITEHADEGRDRPSLFFTEEAIDELVRGETRVVASQRRSIRAGRPAQFLAPAGTENTGRTSIEPRRTAGIIAAYRIASSRSAASMR